MNTRIQYSEPRSSIAHPSHSIPDEIANGHLTSIEETRAALARQNELESLGRPNEEERRIITEIREAAMRANGVKPEAILKLRDLARRRSDRVKEALGREAALRAPDVGRLWDSKPVLPGPTDPTFWWARTDWWTSSDFNSSMAKEGLRFSGGPSTHDGDLHRSSFGAVALFELPSDRIPMSLSRRWLSTPHIEVLGGFVAHTADYAFTDAWSKCWMHRDQRLYQWGFGQDGPVELPLGQAHEVEQLVFEEDQDRTVNVGLRGFQWMPPVTFSNINPASSLWARVEVRFDVQTEGAGSILWIDPELILRTFQWPLTAL